MGDDMATYLHGIPVQLEVLTETGTDDFNRPTYSSAFVTVENVLVGRPTTEEQRDALNLTGKRIEYWIGIPKDDAHDWKDKVVQLPAPFSCKLKTFGFVQTAIQDLIPLAWGARVAAEVFE